MNDNNDANDVIIDDVDHDEDHDALILISLSSECRPTVITCNC